MPFLTLQRFELMLRWGTVALGIAFCAIITLGVSEQNSPLQGYLMRQKTVTPWFTIDQTDVQYGVTVPSNTNVVFHLPLGFGTIDREVLLGQKGKTVRYWGYCFPQNYNPELVTSRVGFPGQMFLSEKEQAARAAAAAANAPQFSLQNLPSKSQLQHLQNQPENAIRNQINDFTAGMLCYIMTESPLSLGLDADGDGLNTKMEALIGTDPTNPDTDGDGISDGVEYLHGTNPLLRDTDGDGIIDGIEDKNWNGRMDPGETDPRNKDSDRDGLCDGMCLIRLSNGQQI